MGKLKKRSDGRYQKRIRFPDGTQKFIYGKSEPEVNAKERALRKEYDAGLKIADDITVGEWVSEWFKVYKSNLRIHTQQSYVNSYDNHISQYLGKLKLKEVKAIHVQQVMNGVSQYSEDLQRKVLNTMRQFFREARINHLMIGDPTEGIKITAKARDERIKYLTREQQSQLMENVTDPRARAFCALAMYAGLRREEALGLQWGDIKEDHLTIKRAVTFLKNQPDPDQSLKSKAANREIPIPQMLGAILEETPKTGLYIINSVAGREMTLTAFRRMWGKVTSAVDFSVHPHMLRHTYATILYNAGIDLKTAQYLLGHSDIKMTANIYTHIEKGITDIAAQKLNSFLAGSQNSSQNSKKS